MPKLGTRTTIVAVVTVLLASSLLAACGSDTAVTDNASPGPSATESTSSNPTSDHQQALDAYKNFLAARQELVSIDKSSWKAHMQPYATGEALAAVTGKQSGVDTSMQVTGTPVSRPQVVAWGDKGTTIMDCQDTSGVTKKQGYGAPISSLRSQLFLALMAPTQNKQWKASIFDMGESTCISPSSYITTAPQTYPAGSAEAAALAAYRKYREVSYTLTKYPENQRKGMLEKYAEGDPLISQLDHASSNEKMASRM